MQTCDILGAVAPYAARNNITYLSVVSSRQRSIMIGEDVRKTVDKKEKPLKINRGI